MPREAETGGPNASGVEGSQVQAGREADWCIDALLVGDGEHVTFPKKVSRRKTQGSKFLFSKNRIYAAGGAVGSAARYWQVEETTINLWDHEGSDVVKFKISQVSPHAAPLRDGAVAKIQKNNRSSLVELHLRNARMGHRRSNTRSVVIRRELLIFLRRNPGWEVAIGGAGMRGKDPRSSAFHDRESPHGSVFADTACALRGAGRCLPVALSISFCILFGRFLTRMSALRRGDEHAFKSDKDLFQYVLSFLSSNYVEGLGLSHMSQFIPQIVPFLRTKHGPTLRRLLASAGGTAKFGKARNVVLVLKRVCKRDVETFLRYCHFLQSARCESEGDTSVEPLPEVLVIRFTSRRVDHVVAIDVLGKLLYDNEEPYPMKLSLSSLGISAGLGIEADKENLARHILEVRAIVDRNH